MPREFSSVPAATGAVTVAREMAFVLAGVLESDEQSVHGQARATDSLIDWAVGGVRLYRIRVGSKDGLPSSAKGLGVLDVLVFRETCLFGHAQGTNTGSRERQPTGLERSWRESNPPGHESHHAA